MVIVTENMMKQDDIVKETPSTAVKHSASQGEGTRERKVSEVDEVSLVVGESTQDAQVTQDAQDATKLHVRGRDEGYSKPSRYLNAVAAFESIQSAGEVPIAVEPSSGQVGRGSLSRDALASNDPLMTSYQSLEGSLKGSNSSTAAERGRGRSLSMDGQPPSTILVQTNSGSEIPGRTKSPKITSSKSAADPPAPQPIPSSGSSLKAKSGGLRRGKWTVEEEAYVARVIQDFNSGFLDAPAGTTLRTYLSEKLQCDPMRITKKFTGDACIGKRVFHPAVRSPSNAATIDKAQDELDNLERRWRRRLEMQQRESAKKAAAAAVAAGRGADGSGFGPGSCHNENVITKTASWLDRANSVLKEPPTDAVVPQETSNIQAQIQEVQRLIHEGPAIQQTSVGLPTMLEQAEDRASTSSPEPEPADKRMRTAEDAEALVGFLRSVRASAASGRDC